MIICNREDHSGAAVHRYVLVFVAFHAENRESQSQTEEDCQDYVAVVGHDEHHGGNVYQGVDQDVEKSEDVFS